MLLQLGLQLACHRDPVHENTLHTLHVDWSKRVAATLFQCVKHGDFALNQGHGPLDMLPKGVDKEYRIKGLLRRGSVLLLVISDGILVLEDRVVLDAVVHVPFIVVLISEGHFFRNPPLQAE